MLPLVHPGRLIIGVSFAQFLVGFLFVSIRSWIHVRCLGKLRRDDYFLWASLACTAGVTVAITVAATQGFGRHAYEFANPLDVIMVSKTIYSLGTMVLWASFFARAAVAIFLLQIVTQRSHRWVLYGSLSICAGLTVAFVLGLFLQCTPFEANWNFFAAGGKCSKNIFILNYAGISYNTFLDFFYAAFPWMAFRKLQMPYKEKVTICLSLSLGVVAGGFGILRFAYTVYLQNHKEDGIYKLWQVLLISATETMLVFIGVCFPALRTLYRRSRGAQSSQDPSSSSRGYRLHERSRGNRTSQVGDFIDAPHNPSSRTRRHRSTSPSKDSERSILEHELASHIIQTTTIVLDSESVHSSIEKDTRVVNTWRDGRVD